MAETWRERHRDALAPSEIGKCLHCCGARLAGEPETRPFSAAKKRRMSVGEHFQSLELERLKERGEDFYAGQQVKLEGLAIPVRGTPDFVVRRNGGFEIVEVKSTMYPPPTLPREWGLQAGAYALRYESCPVVFALYDLDWEGQDDRPEMRMETPPPELVPMLQEWTGALRLVLDGKVLPKDLPHEPAWCARSEWACPDCVGQRQATELSPLEAMSLDRLLPLYDQFASLKQAEKEYEAAKKAGIEIAAAHGSEIVYAGRTISYRAARNPCLNKDLIPKEILLAATFEGVPRRTLIIKREEK